jgi:DNA polymerase III sliding clamp (beta) subunit (PCNA family)
MKNTIETTTRTLRRALETVKPAIDAKALVPVLENALIEAKSGTVFITGCCLSQTIRHRFAAEAGDGRFLLPAAQAIALLKQLPDGPN